jgi:hypothetical protein
MPQQNSRLLLVNGLAVGAVALLQINLDVLGYFFGLGITGPALVGNIDAIAYTEAHGLAGILSLLFILRRNDGWAGWHATAAGMHLLLGTCNIVFWPVFTTWGLVPMGIGATLMHAIFFILETWAFARARNSRLATS